MISSEAQTPPHTHSKRGSLTFCVGEVPRQCAESKELVRIDQSTAEVTTDKQTHSRLRGTAIAQVW